MSDKLTTAIDSIVIALIFALIMIMLYGCAAPLKIIEYKYIENNCTDAKELIAPREKMNILFIAIDINGTRFYATENGTGLAIELSRE